MECPDCKADMDEEAGYSEDEDNIYASYSCPECPTVFDGWLVRDNETTQEKMDAAEENL